jgi:hypothetical protein
MASRQQTIRQNLSGNAQAGLGAQLTQKVRSGALDQGQARRVASQRALLAKAFGPEWRTKVYGQGGAKGIDGSFASREIAAKRAQALSQASRKFNGGTTAP